MKDALQKTRILVGVLQKYSEVFSKNTERCSAKLLRGVLHSDIK